MTVSMFLAELAAGLLRPLPIRTLHHTPHVYPLGVYIRWRLCDASDAYQLLDPVTLVWYARTGEYRTVLDALRTAYALGLDEEDVERVLLAADTPVDRLTDRPDVVPIRRGLEGFLRGDFRLYHEGERIGESGSSPGRR